MNIPSLTPSLHTQFSVAHRIIVWRRWYENVVQCCCKVIAPFPDSNIAFPLLLTITVALLLSYHSLTHHSSSTHHSLITHSSPTHLAFSMQFGFTIDTHSDSHSDAFTHTLTYFNNILPLHYITLHYQLFIEKWDSIMWYWMHGRFLMCPLGSRQKPLIPSNPHFLLHNYKPHIGR